MAKKGQQVAGIDIGTTKICTALATVEEEGPRILGAGVSKSVGLKQGFVSNLALTIESVKKSIRQVEERSERTIDSAWVSVSGEYITGINRHGGTVIREVKGKAGRVTADDIDRAVTEAMDFNVPKGYEIIHVLTQDFAINGRGGISNPLGMTGERLDVYLHVVLHASAAIQNVVAAVNKAGVMVKGVVMQQLASAEAILTNDEKQIGSLVVDIGGGTTDVAFYKDGSIWHSEVLPVAGDLVTSDIALGLRTPLKEAEKLKIHFGHCIPEDVPEQEAIEVEEIGTGRIRRVRRRELCDVIQARCDQIIAGVAAIAVRAGVRNSPITGAVFTGGGALTRGLTHRAAEKLDIPVRLGLPTKLQLPTPELYSPHYCTALGLIVYGSSIHGGGLGLWKPSRPKGLLARILAWLLALIG